jgi:hypothetical protein
MERLFLLLVIFAVLLMPGCSDKADSNEQQQQSSSWDPLDVFMANHIRAAHSLCIGTEPLNDLIIEYDGGELLVVRFSDSMVEQTEGQIYDVFKFPDTGQEMGKKEYLVFLTKLHAYLTINPIKRKKQGQ